MTSRRSAHRDHLAVTREAGLGRISWLSVLAGLVCAYGSFAVIAAVVGSVLSALDVTTDFRTDDWTSSGGAALLVTALVLLVAYLFGGYVAGRMARRAAMLHGMMVFIGTLVIGAGAGALVATLSDDEALRRSLRGIGVPTSTGQVTDVAMVGVIVSLAAILAGSVLGAMLGERWHIKLARRAADPTIGPAAEARAQADREDEARPSRISNDELVRSDVERGGRPDAPDRQRAMPEGVVEGARDDEVVHDVTDNRVEMLPADRHRDSAR